MDFLLGAVRGEVVLEGGPGRYMNLHQIRLQSSVFSLHSPLFTLHSSRVQAYSGRAVIITTSYSSSRSLQLSIRHAGNADGACGTNSATRLAEPKPKCEPPLTTQHCRCSRPQSQTMPVRAQGDQNFKTLSPVLDPITLSRLDRATACTGIGPSKEQTRVPISFYW
jgi:hypothetical protein